MKGIVLFLNGERGLCVLEALLRQDHQVRACVTVIGYKVPVNFRDRFEKLGITHIQAKDAKGSEILAFVRGISPDLFIVAGFPYIFSEELLRIPRLGAINLHAGKLPEYRGGSPLNWQLINNEEMAEISVLYLERGIDSGDVLATKSFPIQKTATIRDLHQKVNLFFPKLVLQVLENFDQGCFEGRPQEETNARYWHQRNDADGRIYFREMTVVQVSNLVRALTRPYPGAWAVYRKEVIRIFSVGPSSLIINGAPGRICSIQGVGPYVICKDVGVLIEDYEVSGNKDFRLHNGAYLE